MYKPQYPIYVISKGRWKRRQTIKTLEGMGVDYVVVVEPSEFNDYSSVVDKKRIITTPEDFSKLGKGSVPVRNWVWDRSKDNGDKKHWILDDNIESVERFNNNLKIKCYTPTPFFIMESFVDRYDNVAIAAPNYAIFCPSDENRPPVRINTRCYSCLLIKNDIPYRWRGKYNEDTDLCLRVLKDGYSTMLFNAFLIGKRATMTQGGGNEDIYNETDKRKEFAESLRNQHPDVVKVTKKFNRWHHHVNYKPFEQNNPQKNCDTTSFPKIDNFGMRKRSIYEK